MDYIDEKTSRRYDVYIERLNGPILLFGEVYPASMILKKVDPEAYVRGFEAYNAECAHTHQEKEYATSCVREAA